MLSAYLRKYNDPDERYRLDKSVNNMI